MRCPKCNHEHQDREYLDTEQFINEISKMIEGYWLVNEYVRNEIRELVERYDKYK